jgi:lysyl-tRNA synthetase, class II
MSQKKVKMTPVVRQRYEKLEKLRELGVDPWPPNFDREDFAADLLKNFEESIESAEEFVLAGRLMTFRRMGKVTFAVLEDQSAKIQLYVQRDSIGVDNYTVFKLFDIGDIVGVRGKAFRTKTGEPSLDVSAVTLLSKNLAPLPVTKEKDGQLFDEFSDKDQRYRQRYVDLIVNPKVREVFKQRSRIVTLMRRYFEDLDFLEVETPILQPIYGGAAARPFVTHHNALDMPLYLRIANELYLKRLIVGGFDRVFEFARDFRNEGMDRFHNPEFTQVELYAAYEDYSFMMEMVENLVSRLAQDLYGDTKVQLKGHVIDLAPPWRRATMMELLEEATGENLLDMDEAAVRALAKKLHLDVDEIHGWPALVDEIFGELVEPKLIQPTFVCDHPLEMSPLAKKHRDNPRLVERFEAVVAGKELCNSFSELNDPVDQEERFRQQRALSEGGDDEAHPMDEDFIRALKTGMPPTAGLGIGIDRLVMLLTSAESIRDVIFFPTMKP